MKLSGLFRLPATTLRSIQNLSSQLTPYCSCSHNYIYTEYYFPFALFGGKVKGINRRGGGALFCDFVSTKWSAFILILIETILKGKNLQPLGANSFL